MSDQSQKLFLLDAYALIYRAYYAFIRAPRMNSKGQNTSAVFGFTNTLLDIINTQQPSHIAVVIDYSGPTFRNAMYSDYKANRESTPEDIKNAVPYIRRILEALNIPLFEIPGFEADDVIGTIALKTGAMGYQTYMVTPDKDFAQLVNENVKIYKPKSKGNEIEIWGVEEVRENFGVPEPVNVIDILALWGDAADNIPGCPGIGEVKAKEIVGKYHNLDVVYANIEEFKGKQKENLINFREQVELARKLVTIEINVPVDLDLNKLKYQSPNFDKLKTVFDELEFRSLWERISGVSKPKPIPVQGSLFDIPEETTVIHNESFKTIAEVKHNYYLIDNDLALSSLTAELSVKKSFCFDTETTGLDTHLAELVGISFSWNAHEAWYVPVPSDRIKADELIKRFKKVLEDPGITKVGQNLKFDALVLKKYGIKLEGPLFDTMVAHHLIQPGLKHNMDYLAGIYLGYSPVSIETLIGPKGKDQKNMRNVPVEQIKEYAAEDADVTWQLKEILEKELKKEAVYSFFYDVMPLHMLIIISLSHAVRE